jgi:hypothetical protein
MAMRVPYLGRIYALPGGTHQFVLRQRLRQAFTAGIEEALIGPGAPGGKTARAQRETARERKKLSAGKAQKRAPGSAILDTRV